MIHPTRTNLLLLREKEKGVGNCIGILRGRRQALIREFLATSRPVIRSREEIRRIFREASEAFALSCGLEGSAAIRSLPAVAGREVGVEVVERSVMGLKYRDLWVPESPVRRADQRGYDYAATTPRLEEALFRLETVVAEMLELAAFESRLKRLGNEIVRITRQIKVLEERLQPELRRQIKAIAQYIGEREREGYYRLKLFKELKEP